MRTARTLGWTVVAVLLVASSARADWDPNYKMHWPQLPDLERTGLDVDAMANRVLADDFLCIETGPITDVHIWGSFADDILPGGANPDPGLMTFILSIHRDSAAAPPNQPFSKPGPVVKWWTFGPGQYQWRLYADNISEGWWDPATGLYVPDNDHQCYQYNFLIDEADAVIQEEGTVYWLDVQAFSPDATFGWKSTHPMYHWNDDSVLGVGAEPNVDNWLPITYPANHPFAGTTLDLAFVITPEPATLALLALGGVGVLARRKRR